VKLFATPAVRTVARTAVKAVALAMLQIVALAVCLCVTAATMPAVAHAQDADSKLRDNKDELARIRREREELQQRMEKLKSSAHNIADEVQNLNRQHDVTQRAMHSLEQQLGFINDAVKQTTASLVRTEDEEAVKQAVLRRRLIDIYKRGPLYDMQALLSAASFGELVARYKYLHEIALYDKAMLKHMDDLRMTIRGKRGQLVSLQGDLRENRMEKQQEEERLRALEQNRKENLVRVQQDAKKAELRWKQLARAESHVSSIIANLEVARRRGSSKASAVARGASSIRTTDYGRLAWPVDGNILYHFGKVTNPNNTVTRWNGVGIIAAPGTPVRSVASGEVRVAEAVGSYGRTVIIEHGGGDYSVYGSLSSIDVTVGERVGKGAIIGTVGSSDPDMPPHLHFEIRHDGPAIDPTTWLRNTQ
jgi:septal ring factor EnvC (AmiA/AmiB activator)